MSSRTACFLLSQAYIVLKCLKEILNCFVRSVEQFKERTVSHNVASIINQLLEITMPLSLGQSKAALFFFKSIKFSFSLSEVNFYIYFLLDAIIWCPKGLEGTGSVD